MLNIHTRENLFFSFLFLLLPLTIFSQIGAKYHSSELGNDVFHHVIQLDNGRIFATGSKTYIENRFGIWFAELSESGDILKEKIFPTGSINFGEIGYRIAILPNDELMILGKVLSIDRPHNQALALRLNLEGEEIWKRKYANIINLHDAINTPDGGFFLVGTESNGALLKVDDDGILEWKKFPEITNHTFVKRIFKLSDGNFLITGRANNNGAGYAGVFMMKINSSGNEIWRKSYHTEYREPNAQDIFSHPLGTIITPDDEIFIVNPGSHQDNTWLMHFDANGDLISKFSFGEGDTNERPADIRLLDNGNMLITGYVQNVFDFSPFAMEATVNGKEIWKRTYGSSSENEHFLSGLPLDSGDLIFVGFGNNGQLDTLDGLVYVTEKNGNPAPYSISGQVLFDINENCVADSEDLPASQIFTLLQGHQDPIAITDREGNFRFRTNAGNFTLSPEILNTNHFSLCTNSTQLTINENNPNEEVVFLIQQKNPCIPPEVHITQPDLNICKKSRFFVTIKNPSIFKTESQILIVDIEPELEFIAASGTPTTSGNKLIFDVPEIAPLQSQRFEIIVKTSCDVQIGATHGISAKIERSDCYPSPHNPHLTIAADCTGDNQIFTIKNNGTINMPNAIRYRTYQDEFEIVGGTIQLNAEEIAEIIFPADGLTRRVEIDQILSGKPISAIVEACGVTNFGLHSIGYKNAWPRDDSAPNIAYSYHPNTTGQPNKISESITGYGYRHLVDDIKKLEFTARASNPLSHVVEEVEFQLNFNENFDLSTFQVLSSNTTPEVTIDNNQIIKVKMSEVDISPDEESTNDAFVKFRINAKPGVFPNSQSYTLLYVSGIALFNDEIPLELQSGWVNYTTSAIKPMDSLYVYPEEISLVGGRGVDFSFEAAKSPFGRVYFSGLTDSYNGFADYDGYIVKMEPNGDALWKKVYALELGGEERFQALAPLPDGGLMVAGAFLPPGVPISYLNDHQALVGRIDSDGNLLWHKTFSPGSEFTGYIFDMVETSDSNFVVSGYADNGNGLIHFLTKISPDGDFIWSKVYDDIRFGGNQIFETSDGSLLIIGEESEADLFIKKTDAEGNILWTKSFSEENKYIYPEKAILNEDGSFMVCGHARWSTPDDEFVVTPFFAKFDHNGDTVFVKTPIIGPLQNAETNGIIKDPNGGFYVYGQMYIDYDTRFRDALLLKINDEAEVLWYKNYGRRISENVRDAVISDENQLLLLGYNQQSPLVGHLQSFLIRTDLEGSLFVNLPEEPESQKIQFAIAYPNPTHSNFRVELKNRPQKPGNYKLFDLNGKEVISQKFSQNNFQISLNGLNAGVYFLAFPEEKLPTIKVLKVD